MTRTTQEETQLVTRMIQDIKVAMLTTIRPDGSLHSRPMAAQDAEFDGTLWFFTSLDSPKVVEVEQEQQVNVTYADPVENRYVTISGRAMVVLDRNKIEELWNPTLNGWFPLGLEDPQIALLRVEVDSWEYWDCQTAKMVPRDTHKPTPPADLVREPEKLRTADMHDTWVFQDVGTKKSRDQGAQS